MLPRVQARCAIVFPTALVAGLVLSACKSDPPPIAECPATDGGETGCGPGFDDEDISACGDPEFDTSPPSATEYACEGIAGGAIVYNSVTITIAGDEKGGPGHVQTDPAETEFPGTDGDVSACCSNLDPVQDEQVIETACKRDCGRAACNRILDELRTQAMASDPSDGKCDPLPGDFKTDCRNRVKGSLESWIAQIEANYEQCVAAAVYNDNPSLPYTEHDSAFAEEGKLVFDDWGCNKDLAGCLYGAELRPFCKIDDFTEGDSCQQAENPIDQEATGDGGVVDSSSGGGVVDPFGDVGTLVSCSPQTTCTIEQELISNVQTNFNVFYDEGVELTLGTYGTGVTGLEISGLDAGDYAKELFDEFGVYNDDVITHVNGTALDSGEDVWDVIAAMDSVSQWNITVRRPRGGSYLTYNYTIALPVSIEAGPQERNGGGTSGADAGGQNDGRGCGCSQTGKGKYAAFGTLLLFGLTGRRRRRATQA